ncbi:MAG: SRPBCC domain-containing protein [Planctomycetaceae bacterium]|nr:SRPBCC domain-containing protein [Planctomycetaceae bacterium]
MGAVSADDSIQSLRFQRDVPIEASVEIVWESVIEQFENGEGADGKPMPFKFEPWPGGRWFRDLGDNAGHLWGHVQVIKPPKLLEVCGPMFMSYAATTHAQYRLIDEGDRTNLRFTYSAVGLIAKEHREGVQEGWGEFLTSLKNTAERRARS